MVDAVLGGSVAGLVIAYDEKRLEIATDNDAMLVLGDAEVLSTPQVVDVDRDVGHD